MEDFSTLWNISNANDTEMQTTQKRRRCRNADDVRTQAKKKESSKKRRQRRRHGNEAKVWSKGPTKEKKIRCYTTESLDKFITQEFCAFVRCVLWHCNWENSVFPAACYPKIPSKTKQSSPKTGLWWSSLEFGVLILEMWNSNKYNWLRLETQTSW